MSNNMIEISPQMPIWLLFQGDWLSQSLLLWFMSHWRLNCKYHLSLSLQRWNQFMTAGYLLLDLIHYGQSSSAGHLVNTLTSPQAFTGKRRRASSFNAQSRRNQWKISPTHYLTLMPYGIKRAVWNTVKQIFFSKHTLKEFLFNLSLC